MTPAVSGFFDPTTKTVSYLVADPASRAAVVIDPVLDYQPSGARIGTEQLERILAEVEARGLAVAWILETHPHADHLSAGGILKTRLRARTAIGAGITEVQRTWQRIYNLNSGFRPDGSQFDRLLRDGDRIPVGGMTIEAMATPGHTPACVTYRIGDCAFVGDTLFMPDYGTARCDFPGGDARTLYRSIRRILALPPGTRLFTCHDYAPGGREVAWETTVAAQRAGNLHVHDGVEEDAFVAMRELRDRTLSPPDLILPAIQVNIRAGDLPSPDANGIAYLRIPLNAI
jgi:glyoxylase-like metal-dependent hydrolase (beta-lactamase superfamily II)